MSDWFWSEKGKSSPEGASIPTGSLAEVRAYWEGLRNGTALPRRDQINPRGISSALESVFVAERIGKGLATFRIAGMKINELIGTEARGLPVSLLFTPTARTELGNSLERVFTKPAIADVFLAAELGTGRAPLMARLLLLPLVGQSGSTDLCLGCIALSGDIGRNPRRFALTRRIEEVLSFDKTNPADTLAFAEPAASFTSSVAAFEKPHLRLVHSRDNVK